MKGVGGLLSTPIIAILLESPKLICVKPLLGIADSRYSEPEQQNLTELVLVQNGRAETVIDNKIFSIHAGDLLIYNPLMQEIDRSVSDPAFKAISIVVSNLHIQGKQKGLILDPLDAPIIQLHQHFHSLEYYFKQIYMESHDNKFGSSEIIYSLLQTILILILRITNQHESFENVSEISQTVRDYINGNYQKDLSLNDLAGIVYISPYHLAHTFKEEIGMSPIQYLIKCRIDEAKKLLAGSGLSVREIAANVGYPNANYFNLLFKKMTGEAPGKYRKLHSFKS